MDELRAVVDAAVAYASSRGAECEVWLERRVADEYRADCGELHHSAHQETSTAVITTWRGGREGCVVVSGLDAIDEAVDAALSVGDLLPPQSRVPRGPAGALSPKPPLTVSDPALPTVPSARLAALSARSTLVRDVTMDDHRAVTAFGTSDGMFMLRRTGRAVVQLRCATGHGPGALSRSFVGPDIGRALASAEAAADDCVERTAALAGPESPSPLPPAVVLHGSVVSRLLALLAPSLQLDSVREGRSRLADRLGERIAAPGFQLVDDAPGQAFAFDDEGTPTHTVRLLEDGRLLEFLSDRRSAYASRTMSTGAGWRSSSGSEIRVRPCALLAGWDLPVSAAMGPALHVLQACGMHISNDVTGDFSFGAVGLVEDGSGLRRNAGSLTVAGNVIDLLPRMYPVESPIRHAPRSVNLYGSPDMGAEGLAVGR